MSFEAPGYEEPQPYSRVDAIHEICEKIIAGNTGENDFYMLANWTAEALVTEDLDVLDTVERQARRSVHPAFELSDESKAKMEMLLTFARDGMARVIPEVSPEESTWLQLASAKGIMGYKKKIGEELSEAEYELLKKGFIATISMGNRLYVKSTPRGETRLQRDAIQIEDWKRG